MSHINFIKKIGEKQSDKSIEINKSVTDSPENLKGKINSFENETITNKNY